MDLRLLRKLYKDHAERSFKIQDMKDLLLFNNLSIKMIKLKVMMLIMINMLI